MRIFARPPGYAAAMLLATTAAFAAPAAAQASAAAPPVTVVPCSSSALVTAIQNASMPVQMISGSGAAVLRLAGHCNYVLTSAAATDDGLPPIAGKLAILGGPGTTISRSPSAAEFRILEVARGGALTLMGVTVANGRIPDASGGAILDRGTLVLRNVRLTGNTAANGGGLAVGGGAQATISSSDVDGNDAHGGVGGAIFNDDFGAVAVDRSRLARNTASTGGAVYTQAHATTRITGTVVDRNSATQDGGGFLNLGATVLTGDRVVLNKARLGGGGIRNIENGTVTLRLTVVALNTPDNCASPRAIPGCRN